jgi:hypothetical protein
MPVSENIAAIMVDAVFQAGLNYRTVVLPRVWSVARSFPKLDSLRALEAAMRTRTFATALNWVHAEKPQRLRELVAFLRMQGLETIRDLRAWLGSAVHRERLRTVRGVGYKTVDYLAKLVGLPTIAVDRHAHRLLREVGIIARGYVDARRILEFAADLLCISRSAFDRLMWDTLSARA